ncbi:MAG: hypothetical protein Q9163_004229 [Psora crenata]
MADKAVIFLSKRMLKNRRKNKEGNPGNVKEYPYHYIDYSGNLKRDDKGNIIGPLKLKDENYYMKLGIPKEDAALLAKVKRRAKLLDGSHESFLGLGLSSVIGFVPVVGDTTDLLLALTIISKASKVSNGLDAVIRGKMVWNVILDLVIGLMPVLGDFADILFKCNTKNSVLLEDMLKKRVEDSLDEAEKAGNRGRRPGHYDRHAAASRHPTPPGASSPYGAGHATKQRPTQSEDAYRQGGRFVSARDL